MAYIQGITTTTTGNILVSIRTAQQLVLGRPFSVSRCGVIWLALLADSYEIANGQGIPLPAGAMITVDYGTGTICPAPLSVQYNAGSGLCCKAAGADGTCASWCQPGAMDCVDQDNPESTIISQEASETMQNFCLAAAVALEQYAVRQQWFHTS